MSNPDSLGVADRLAIFEQLHAHQRAIDGDASRAYAMVYVDLYWPEATFTVHDLRHTTFQRGERPQAALRPRPQRLLAGELVARPWAGRDHGRW